MEKYIVTSTTINIKEAPTVNSNVIGFLSEGDVIDGHDISGDGKWLSFYRETGKEKQKGWVSNKYLLSLVNDALIEDNDFPWTKVAIREMGVREFYETSNNPRILQYLRSTELLNSNYQSKDETYWCSSFVNWCIEKSGIEGTNSPWARHWLNWGIAITTPFRGCIVVFKRGTGGHVGFYMKETKDSIYVLGGNQDDEVNIKRYSKVNLLGFRTIISND